MSQVKRYRKKPVVIEAVKVTHANWDDIVAFIPEKNFGGGVYLDERLEPIPDPAIIGQAIGVFVHTLEGIMLAREGDMLIKGVAGEVYPCKPAIFAQIYEPEFDDVLTSEAWKLASIG